MNSHPADQLLREVLDGEVALPARIIELHGDMRLYAVEDLNGKPLAFATDVRMARLIFAAPGLLNTLESLATALGEFGRQGGHLSQDVAESLVEAMRDAGAVLDGASRVVVVVRDAPS